MWARGNISSVSMKIKQQMLHDDLTSCTTWLHLGAPFLIRRTRLNDDNAHPGILYELLFEDEMLNLTAMPKFGLFLLSLQWKMYSLIFWVIELLRYLNSWISCFLPLLDSFLYPRSGWKWDFVERIGRFYLLNSEFVFEIMEWKAFNSMINWIISSVILG